jgi:hypothetical protein
MKSIMHSESDGYCYLCGAYLREPERHHVFGGTANRRLSEKYGLTVRLCPDCHRQAHSGGNGLAETLHIQGQLDFERANPDLIFINVFGRNYL